MRSSWSPAGACGIDGYIEFFDPTTQAALGKVLAVQSKVVANPNNENADGFDYYCDERDVEYWPQGNVPVILIVSQPERGEAFWVSIKDYFNSHDRRTVRKVHFSKGEDRFDCNALNSLLRAGVESNAGLYLEPTPKPENLISNLPEVTEFPTKIWMAATECPRPHHVWQFLEVSKMRLAAEWFLHEDFIISFQDLSQSPWTEVCDPGTRRVGDILKCLPDGATIQSSFRYYM
jgi:hypothetical protein